MNIDGIRVKEGVPFGRYQFEGKRYELSLAKLFPTRELKTKVDVKAAFDDMRSMIRKGELNKKKIVQAAHASMGDFITVYMKEYCQKSQKGRKPMIVLDAEGKCRTSSEFARIHVIKEYFGKQGLVALSDSPFAIQEFVEDELQAEREVGSTTVNRYLARLKHMFNYAMGERDLWGVTISPFSHNKVKALFSPEEPRVRRVSLDEEGILGVGCDGALRMRILAALRNGMRRGEILNLQLKEINFKTWVIQLDRAKVKTAKSAHPFPIDQDPELRAFLSARRFLGAESYPFGLEDGTVCPIVAHRAAWEAQLRRAFGVTDHTTLDLHFHDLRAECATRLLSKGMPLSLVAGLLRDREDTIEKHYKRVIDVDTIRKAMNG